MLFVIAHGKRCKIVIRKPYDSEQNHYRMTLIGSSERVVVHF